MKLGRTLAIVSVACLGGVSIIGCSGGSSGGGGSSSVVAPATSSQNPGVLSGLTIQPAQPLTVENDLGAGFQIIVDGEYTDDAGLAYQLDMTRDVTYKVEDESVARVGGDGLITPVAEGVTKVEVEYNGPAGVFGATTTVTVVAPQGGSPVFKSLQVLPIARSLKDIDPANGKEQLQQMVVVATDDAGRLHDLTRSIGITVSGNTSGDPTTLASSSPNGLIRAVNNGEVYAVARLTTDGLVAGSHLVLGTGVATPVDSNDLYSGAPLAGSANELDKAILENLFKQFIEPAPLASDGEFLRRLYADALNRTPTVAEVESFQNDADPDKKTSEIDKVLASPEFAATWGQKMGEWFAIQRNGNGTDFDTWASAQITADRTMGEMVSDMAAGNVPSFETQHDTSTKKVDILLIAGTGYTAECSYCHDHPLVGPNDTVQWTQADRYPLDAFFEADDNLLVPRDKAGIRNGNNGQPHTPGFVLDPTATVTSTLQTPIADRRTEFAALFTASDAFKRGMAHRVYAEVVAQLLNPNNFLQKELDAVMVPNVLTALTAAFDANGTSLKGFLRTIFTSRFYQMTTSADGLDTQYDPFLQRFPLRRHHAEVVDAALDEVTGATLNGGDLTFFHQTFGYPETRTTIGERINAVNMSQSLVVMNSPIVQDRITGAKISQLATDVSNSTITQTEAIHKIFRAALSRDATSAEISCCNDTIGQAATVEEGLQDVSAAVCSTIEFVLR